MDFGLIFFRFVASGGLLWSVMMYLLDLHFYWRHGWDYSIDHPGFQMRHTTDDDVPASEAPLLSNAVRVQTGWPVGIVFYVVLVIVAFSIDHTY